MWTGYSTSWGVFVIFATPKRGLVSVLSEDDLRIETFRGIISVLM